MTERRRGSVTDPRNFFIELDNYPGHYFPGHTVSGKVIRFLEESEEEIEYFNLKLKGMAIASWFTREKSNHAVVTHSNEETYFDITIILNQKDDDTWITSLKHGKHEFPFSYQLPAGIPASYKDTEVNAPCRIFYQAEASYKAMGERNIEILALVNLPVLRPLDLDMCGYTPEPKVLERYAQMCICCCKRSFSFKLILNKMLFSIGENIEFTLEMENNGFKKIEDVQVWITKTVYFEATDKQIHFEIWNEQVGETFGLPGVPARQKIEIPVSVDIIPRDYEPIDCMGCSFMHAANQLHVKVMIPGADILTGALPILIWTGHPDVTGDPNSNHT